MMGRRVPRCLNRSHERVPELHHIAIGKRNMLKRNARAGGQVRDRTCVLDERGQTRDVVRLNVRLEHSHDRCANRRGRSEIVVDEICVRIDDRQLPVRGTAEQVTRTGAGIVQEGTKQHSDLLLLASDLDRPSRAPPLREADVKAPRL
jgi:hypothetical protein